MRRAAVGHAAALLVACLLAAGCSIPNPLAGVAVDGSGHGGWGAPRPAHGTTAEQEEQLADLAPEDSSDAQPVEPPRRVAEQPRERERPTPPAHAAPEPAADEPAAAPSRAEPLDDRLRRRQAADAAPVTEPAPSAPPPAAETPSSAVPSSGVPAATAAATIERVSFAERSDGRGFVVRVHTTQPVPAHVVESVAEGRLQLTLFRTDVGESVRRDRPLGGIRDYSLQGAADRAVLTLDVDPELFYERQPYSDRNSHDLLLPLVFVQRPVAAARPAATPAVATGANGADAASQARWRFDCVVIDAGHGGRDPGAVAHGVREKDVNLGIALKLGTYIEEQLGVQVVYTRRDDRFVELAERGRIANQSCGKLFISIHANSAANRSAQGTETYFLGLHRSESARRVMERENSVIALESDPSLYSGMDEAALIMQTMAQSTYLRASEQLAGLIENQFVSRASRNSRGVKQAGFLVLWRASMPAVLIETGFITNRQEARFLASAHGQERIAYAIFEAVRDFKKKYERGLGIASN